MSAVRPAATGARPAGAGGAVPLPRLLVAALVFELLGLAAAAAWWPVYQGAAFLVAALVAVTVGTALAALGARFRWSGPVLLLAVLAAWLLLGVPLAVPGEALWGVLPSGAGLADLVVTAGTGWRQLLTIALPVGSYQALLVPAFTLLLVASTVGLTVALRTRLPALGVLAPALALTGGLVFGTPDTALDGFPSPALVGAVFAALVIVWIALGGTRPRPRTAAAAAGVLAVGLVVAVGVVAILPTPDRAALRDTVDPPFDAQARSSPLSAYRALVKEPAASAVQLTVAGAEAGSLVAVARMDAYDGVVYTVGHGDAASGVEASALFPRVTGRLGVAPDDVAGRSEMLELAVEDYAGVWVPTVGDPREIAFLGDDAEALQNELFANPALQTVAVLPGLSAGDRYRLSTAVGADAAFAPGAALADATPGAAVRADADAVVPDAVAVRLTQWAPDARSPGARLAGIVAGLRSGYLGGPAAEGTAAATAPDGTPGAAAFSRAGHSAERIQELLTAEPMIGDAEQYAVAGALLAEAAGFPARVAIGFTVPESAGSAATAVLGRDATAWLEVYTADAGWLAVDVTPDPRPIPESESDDSRTAVAPPAVLPPADDDLDDRTATAPQQQDDTPPPADDALLGLLLQIAAIAGIALAVLAVLLAPLVAVLALKHRRRRRRRRTGTPRERAVGSWSEVTDAARDLGVVGLPVRATRREAGALLDPAALALAHRVDGAQFGPVDPADDELEALWRASDTERARLGAGVGRWRRLRARVSLRSLRRYDGRRDDRQDER